MIENAPTATVCVVSYNQKQYLSRCLDSILSQNVNFAFEIVVSDDQSTDGSIELIESYASKFPDIIRVASPAVNLGALANYRHVHRSANGEFVAHIDGDDYLLPGKLQRQVEFLRANPNCGLSAHIMAISQNNRITGQTRNNPEWISLSYLLSKHPAFLNSTIMYRRELLQHVFEPDIDFIDFYVYVQAARLGPIGFMNEALSVYRANIGISESPALLPFVHQAIDVACGALPEKEISKAHSRQTLRYAMAALRAGDDVHFRALMEETRELRYNLGATFAVYQLRRLPSILRFLLRTVDLARFWIRGFRRPKRAS